MPQELLDEVLQLYQLLETFLERTKYMADNHATVADFSITISITSFELFVPVEQDKHPKLFGWLDRMKGLPCYQANVPGSAAFEAMVNEKLNA